MLSAVARAAQALAPRVAPVFAFGFAVASQVQG